MFSNRSTFSQITNRKGQVALFVALIFQILFLFFAMVINVGLLVHHKINLQNSVDLAAYYGAMKQAEGMNAIAHTNYQIRQSYKLLAWRYRMIGSAGEFRAHPYSKSTHQFQMSTDDIVTDTPGPQKNFQEAPAFCITYVPFKGMPPNENTCKDMANRSGITVFNAPPLIAGHQVFSGAIRRASEVWRDNLTQRCKLAGSYNYYMLGKFVVAFNVDQGERMYLISLLSQGLSYKQDDFYDIDGSLVSEGIANTLKKNLTSANNNSDLAFKVYNSLGADGCNAMGGGDKDLPAQWLTPIKIYPGFSYIDNECPDMTGGRINTVSKELTGNLSDKKTSAPNYWDEMTFANDIRQLSGFIGYRSNLNDTYNFSLGVEKNPWCMAYVGVSATAKPKIPFSPFGGVTLKARAFYKPFGGRIGPWYKETWPKGSKFSSVGDKMDKLAPPRVSDIASLQTANQKEEEKAVRAVNHSRFVGDRYGLKTLKMLGFYGKAIYEMDPGWRNMFATGANDSYVTSSDLYEGSTAPNFADWDDIPFNFSKGSGDILAWDSATNAPSKMRNLELMAVLPDPFDMAYYSIEPDFYRNYYTRIRDGFLAGPGKAFVASGKVLRPDIGYHKGFKSGQYNLEEFSIKDQYRAISDSGMQDVVEKEFTFLSKDWRNVLTGWVGKDLLDYSLDTQRFGKCLDSEEPNPATAGNCVVGGTTGYSVKMVSSSYLRSEIRNLGGEGASGTIINPPPDDNEF
ncbi:Tad domain-containing protein [Bdellovibrio sp. HCB2-146]|uniref:Tad domain-containing protein n=1 Tax=Bdellovibrio sp. HCB2-146 TaxID=3394362 RepID=UPI0039BCDED5